jgi:hypothetical protein
VGTDKYANEKLPGLSMNMLLRIKEQVKNRRGYIFDVGGEGKSRFSAYVSPDNMFTLSLTGKNGESYPVLVPMGEGGIPIRNIFFLTAEYGVGNGHTVIRLRVNGKEVGIADLPFIADVHTTPIGHTSVGVDSKKKNGGVFDGFGEMSYGVTLTADEVHELIPSQMERVANIPSFLVFSGYQGVQH